jgi:CRISPR/Cas system Type II protein with McrA/HNH and RuvC-like nuclease domain
MEEVLVLNYDYSPLNVTSIKRGFNLVYKGKAEIIKSDVKDIICGVKNFARPLIIRLLSFIGFHKRTYRANRTRIYKRDNYECVYCGSKKTLTIDHVIPKSKGGSNSWENLVTSCFKCNLKKANRTPEEAKMKMRHSPYVPTIMNDNYALLNVWNDFQKTLFS